MASVSYSKSRNPQCGGIRNRSGDLHHSKKRTAAPPPLDPQQADDDTHDRSSAPRFGEEDGDSYTNTRYAAAMTINRQNK